MAWWKFWERETRGRRAPDYYDEGVSLLRQELHHDALTSFRLALRQRPDDAATLEQMAVAYTHIGLSDDAIKSYQRALEIRPTSPSAHYGLAFLLLKAGHVEAAVVHLEAFLDRARPDREDARQIAHAQKTLARVTGQAPSALEERGAEAVDTGEVGPDAPYAGDLGDDAPHTDQPGVEPRPRT